MGIGADMLQLIQAKLSELEQEYSVRVLYAIESGSRAWGFASADSDYDVRFIYAHEEDHYLRVDSSRDVIELPIEGDLDINGWDIFKACSLLRKSNPPLMEWLGSPIIYRDIESFAPSMREIAAKHFSLRACGHHYLSMTKRNWKGYIDGRDRINLKKYLYGLRPVVCLQYMLQYEKFAPTSFIEGLDALDLTPQFRDDIDALLDRKASLAETGEGERVSSFDDYICDALNTLPDRIDALPRISFPVEPLNQLVLKVLRS